MSHHFRNGKPCTVLYKNGGPKKILCARGRGALAGGGVGGGYRGATYKKMGVQFFFFFYSVQGVGGGSRGGLFLFSMFVIPGVSNKMLLQEITRAGSENPITPVQTTIAVLTRVGCTEEIKPRYECVIWQ